MMTLVEAKRVLQGFEGGVKVSVVLAMSGTGDTLCPFLQAEAAVRGVALQVTTLAFGTLHQHLVTASGDRDDGVELFVLMPWDLVPECDWRSGFAGSLSDYDAVWHRASSIATALTGRPRATLVYLPAPIPPVFACMADNHRLAADLSSLAMGIDAVPLDARAFSLTSYLANGCPIGGKTLPEICEALADTLLAAPASTYKVLATDADETLWRGVAAEDGTDSVSAEPQGTAFRHFLYQTFLLRLKAAGILLAIVSRNDQDTVLAALGNGHMHVGAQDFVSIRAGYRRKSEELADLAKDLGLARNAIVFVDNNPVELAEVTTAIPEIRGLVFPSTEEEFDGFLRELATLFDRPTVTSEDEQRTDLYRRRLESMPPADGGDLRTFLRDLRMRLTICDRTRGEHQRALQLINKTNQFNINGVRLDADALDQILAEGGQLFSAQLEDRTGSHGEILACLIDGAGVVRSLVMSCRVLERRVEFAFLTWLVARAEKPLVMAIVATDRNEPARQLMDDPTFEATDQGWVLDRDRFGVAHADDLALFTIIQDDV